MNPLFINARETERASPEVAKQTRGCRPSCDVHRHGLALVSAKWFGFDGLGLTDRPHPTTGAGERSRPGAGESLEAILMAQNHGFNPGKREKLFTAYKRTGSPQNCIEVSDYLGGHRGKYWDFIFAGKVRLEKTMYPLIQESRD